MDIETRAPGLILPPRFEPLRVGGVFHGILLRDGEVIDEFETPNIIVNQGLDHILGVEFGAVPQIGQWYMAPFTNNYVPVGTDTAATISQNAGETTSYTGNTRVPYAGIEGTQQVTNAASPASFTFSAAVSIYGAFLISAAAQNSTTGTLFAAAQFASVKQVAAQDQLLLTYVLAAASA